LVHDFQTNIPEKAPGYDSILTELKAQILLAYLNVSQLDGFLTTMSVLLQDPQNQAEKKLRMEIEKAITDNPKQGIDGLRQTLERPHSFQKFLHVFNSFIAQINATLPVSFLQTVYNEKYHKPFTLDGEELKYPLDNESSDVDGRILYELKAKSNTLKNLSGEDPLTEILRPIEDDQSLEVNPKKSKSPRSQKILSPENKQNLEEINRMLTQRDGKRRRLATGQRVRMRFSDEEIDNLFKGVARYGIGFWAEIKGKYSFIDRKTIDLKDKWRNLLKHHPEETAQRLAKEEEIRRKSRAEKNKPEKVRTPPRRRGRRLSKSAQAEPELNDSLLESVESVILDEKH